MKTIGGFLAKLGIFLLFCAVGLGLGLAVSGYFANLEQSGAFAKWQLLDDPQKFQHLSHVDAYEDYNGLDVRAETSDGTIYRYIFKSCGTSQAQTCGSWLPSEPYSGNDQTTDQLLRSGCQAAAEHYSFYGIRFKLPREAGAAFECGVQLEHDPFWGVSTRTLIVLSETGKVWMLVYKPDLGKELQIIAAGALVGLIAGISAWRLLKDRLSFKGQR